MNNCPKCGSSINMGDAFCRVCGAQISTPQSGVETPQPEPTPEVVQEPIQIEPALVQAPEAIPVEAPVVQNAEPVQTPQTVEPNVVSESVPNVNNPVSQNENDENDDELIDYYIGNKAAQFRQGGFSIFTLLFGYIYVFYRKMYLYGFLWMAIILIISFFLRQLAFIGPVAIAIIMAISFKKLYMEHVRDQVNQIKAENPGSSREQLKAICSQKGGVAIWPIIVFGVPTVIYIGIIIIGVFALVAAAGY